jgi:hypothetical protein
MFRSPFVMVSAEAETLSKQTVWVECRLIPGETYRIRTLIDGGPDTEDKAALIRFDMADQSAGGPGLAVSSSVGPYIYLRTGDGPHRTDRVFSLASPVTRVGLMAWGNRGPAVVRTLTIERIENAGRPTDFFLSFDVEAPMGRSTGDPIDSLVWGRLGGQEYGLRRVCGVLEQHGLRGNFFVDFATCTFEGDDAARKIVDYLVGQGHEVHMHLHPEWLAQAWGLRVDVGKSIKLDSIPYEMARRLLEFTVAKYEQFTGKPPRLFRSGAYRMNPELVLAAGALGIEALSNVRGDMVRDDAAGGDPVADREPFRWENGVIEIPVEVSSPEAATFESYLRKYDAAMKRKTVERTFNVVMHSWSLIRRNERGVHDRFEPEYERRLQQICEHAATHGRSRGYAEYLDERPLPRPVVRLSRIRTAQPERPVFVPSDDVVTCNVCDAVFARPSAKSDRCPGCRLGVAQRQLKHVLDNFGNVFDNRSVLAFEAGPMERREFLAGARQVVDLDSGQGRDLADPLQGLAEPADGAHDCFYGLHVLGDAVDAGKTATRIAHALKQGGLFVSAEPDDAGAGLVETLASYRRGIVLADYAEALSRDFVVTSIPGYDPVTEAYGRIFLAYRR